MKGSKNILTKWILRAEEEDVYQVKGKESNE